MKTDIFEIMEEQERFKKELFDMVYKWGRWDVVADYKVPAFQAAIKEFIDYIKNNE